MWSRTLAVLLLISAPAVAQTLADNAEGVVTVRGNELTIESKVEDPSAVRLGSVPTQRGLGKISFDILGRSRDEVVLLQGKQTENGRNQLEGGGGEFTLHLKKKFMPSVDAAMAGVFSMTADRVEFYVPITAPNLGAGSGRIAGEYIQSPDGNFRTYMQEEATW